MNRCLILNVTSKRYFLDEKRSVGEISWVCSGIGCPSIHGCSLKAPVPVIFGKSPELALWAAPGLVILGWIVYPCLDMEYRVEQGWESDPETGLKAVAAGKIARMEAHKNKGQAPIPKVESAIAVRAAAALSKQEEEESADEEEEETEEEGEEGEESELELKPLFEKNGGTTLEEMWENTYIKAIKPGEDDDDDDEDEDEDDDEEDEEEEADAGGDAGGDDDEKDLGDDAGPMITPGKTDFSLPAAPGTFTDSGDDDANDDANDDDDDDDDE